MSDAPYTIQRFRSGWAIVYTDATTGKRRRHRLVAADRVGAEAEGRQRWRLGDRRQWTVGVIVPAYIDAREAAGMLTAARRRDAWKAMKLYWQDVLPHLIDEPMARTYAARRKAGAATIRLELGMLSVALRWAKAQGHITDAPPIWLPSPPPRQERAITRDQFRKFLAEVKAPHARLYMLVAARTCARPSAVLDLTWDRVDFERRLIDLNPKGRIQTAKRRPVVPIPDDLMEPLQLAHAGRQTDHVIERGGEAIASIKKAFSAASKRSGVHVTPYTLRHSGIVWRAEDGISMPELAQLAGHDDSRTTEKHYARFSPTYLRKAANAGQW
jgi:integrase